MSVIKNAANIPLNQSTGTLPDVSSAMLNWFQPMVFNQLVKQLIDYKVIETTVNINFKGVWQPLGPQELNIKPEGERDWKWFQCHSDISLQLLPDDIIKYEGTQYRVKSKLDYSKYGYYEYHLVEDYTGSGPEVVVTP